MPLALVLNRSRRVAAEDSPAFGAIAERFRRAGDLERAVALCQEGLGKFPNHLSSRVTLGWALLDLGRYDEARVELEQVLKRAPDNLAAIRGLAQLHDRTEHDDVALMQSGPSRWPVVDLAAGAEPASDSDEDSAIGEKSSPWQLPPKAQETVPAPVAFTAPEPVAFTPPAKPASVPAFAAAEDAGVRELMDLEALTQDLLDDPALHLNAAAFSSADRFLTPMPEAPPIRLSPPPVAPRQVRLVESVEPSDQYGDFNDPPDPASAPPPAPAPTLMPVWDEGPGPWPPVFDDDEPAGPDPALNALAVDQDLDVWPPVDRTPEKIEPVADVTLTDAIPSPAPKRGLLGALGKFRRRVDSRREEVLSEYVAG